MSDTQDDHLIPSQNRSELLLSAAVAAFGNYGYTGASLREIARHAGSSLTLISHHYGSKGTLLAAAIDKFHQAGTGHLAALTAAIDSIPTLRIPTLIEAWVRYAVALYGHGPGLPYLRLLLRLKTDPAVDAGVRQILDPAEPTVRKALNRLRPESATETVDLAWEASSAALYCSIARCADAKLSVIERDRRQAALEAYLAAALNSLFEEARSLI